MRTTVSRIEEEKPIDFDFLRKQGFTKDEDLYWTNSTLSIEYDYYSEWMWFGKEGIPRVDSIKRFHETLDTNGDKDKLKELNKKYTLEF